jgi:OOP family OmpA-OmpF porin
MRHGRLAVAILGLAAAAAATPAAAQSMDPSGIYLGGSLGRSQYKDTCKNLFIPCEAEDTSWRFFAGYQFNRNWAVELGYTDLGEATGTGPIPAGGNADMKVHATAFDLTGIGSIYVTQRLSLYGRLGAYMGRTTRDVEFSAFPPVNDAKTNSGFTFGAGVGYNLGPLGLRLEWMRYDNIGTNQNSAVQGQPSGTDDVDVFSLALLFRFF